MAGLPDVVIWESYFALVGLEQATLCVLVRYDDEEGEAPFYCMAVKGL